MKFRGNVLPQARVRYARTGGASCRKAQHDLSRAFSLPQKSSEREALLQGFFLHVRGAGYCQGCWGSYLGKRAEERVLDAFKETIPKFPSWLISFRSATHEEDQRGIDFVLETDVGEIYIQIKHGRPRSRDRRKSRKHGVVILKSNLNLSLAKIYENALTRVSTVRRRIIGAAIK